MLVAGLVSTNQVLGANLLGNSGIESGNFTKWIVFGADNYVSPGTRPRHNEQRPADTALQNEPLFRCGCGQPC